MCCVVSMLRLSLRHDIVSGKSPLITEQVSDARSPTFNCTTIDWNGLSFGGTVKQFELVLSVHVVWNRYRKKWNVFLRKQKTPKKICTEINRTEKTGKIMREMRRLSIEAEKNKKQCFLNTELMVLRGKSTNEIDVRADGRTDGRLKEMCIYSRISRW